MDGSCDFLSCTLEEIALEGLDGITLSTLWVRLSNRPHFSIHIDEYSKKFIWECVAVHRDVEIFQLLNPRPTVEIYNRYDIIDPELGVFMEPMTFQQDVYPIAVVEDDIYRGSCPTYKTRINITSKIRHSNLLLVSLNEALSKWGDHLILVSSPNSRLIALIGTEINPLLELTKEAYVILERIGRSRYHGETSHGQLGLLSLKFDSIHYILAKLHSKRLVTKQKHYLKKKDSRCVTGYLYHLTNFFVRRKTKFEVLMEMMYNILRDKPHHRESSKVLRKELGLSNGILKKVIYSSNQKWFQFVEVPFSEMYPDSPDEERFTAKGIEKIARVVQLVQPFDLDEECLKKAEPEDNIMEAYFDQSKISIDKPIMCQVYYLIEKAGHRGLSLNEIARALTIPRLDARQLCRQLHKVKEVITIMVDHGRQRLEKYICKKFENQSEFCTEFKEQVEKLKGHNSILAVENGNENSMTLDKTELNNSISIKQDESNSANGKSAKNAFAWNLNKTVLDMESDKIEVKPVINPSQLTARSLNRCNMVIEYVKKFGVATTCDLYSCVYAHECDEGYNFKIDRRSLFRLLTKLSKEGHIKIMKTTLKEGDREKEMEFVCDLSVESNDNRLQRAIEQAKFKYLVANKSEPKSKANTKVKKDVVNVPRTKKMKSISSRNSLPVRYLKSISFSSVHEMYGLLPKFIRAKTLHLFLFYLVYEFNGIDLSDKEDPFVYHESHTWKRYISPLSHSPQQGWCILADIIPRMPLSIFLKVINLMYEVPNLHKYLEHPDKQHYLIKHIPEQIRNNIFGGRRYIFKLYNVVNTLYCMGLVSFGPKISLKEKEEVYLYIHEGINIKDTTTSPSGYYFIDKNIKHKTKEYFFKTMKDVETFWIDLETICTSTLVGKSNVADQGTQTLGLSTLMESCQNKAFNDVPNIGVIPGDGLGAAGLDSTLYGHLRRNWSWMNQSLKPAPEKYKFPSMTSTTVQKLFESSQKDNQPENRKRLYHIKRKILDPSNMQMTTNVEPIQSSTQEPPLKKQKCFQPKSNLKVGRKRQLKPCVRQLYCDEKDKVALSLMKKQRTDWSVQEDSFLLVCKVTSLFLDPNSKQIVVPFTVIRDLLQEKFPQLSANKTSRACQRRVRFILFNSETRNSVAAFLGEALQDTELSKNFSVPKPLKRNEEKWTSMYINLFHKLLQKFSNNPSSRKTTVSLPDNLRLLGEQYKILIPKFNIDSGFKHIDPECIQDIYREVIHGLVTLALASVTSKENWSYHLYKLYEQYPEVMTKTVLEQLTKEYLITKSKRQRNNRVQSSAPCRFTVLYENSFITKYPEARYGEAKELLDMLTSRASSSIKGHHEVQLYVDSPMGYTSVLLAFTLMKQVRFNVQIPDHLIIFNSSFNRKYPLDGEVKSFVDNGISAARLCNAAQQSEGVANQSNQIERQAKRMKLCNSNDDPESCQSLDTIFDVGMKDGIESDQSKAVEVKINNSNDFAKTGNEKNLNVSVLESNEAVSKTNIYSTSRLALTMLRQENKSKIERIEHTHDCVALYPCQISCEIKIPHDNNSYKAMIPEKIMCKSEQSTADFCFIGEKSTSIQEIVKGLITYYSSSVPQDLFIMTNYLDLLNKAYEGHSAAIRADGQKLFNHICEQEFLGINHKELWTQFESSLINSKSLFSFHDHLTLLLKSMLVLRVGTICFKYVCVKYGKPWLLLSFTNSKEQINSQNNVNSISAGTHPNYEITDNVFGIKNVLDTIVSKCETGIFGQCSDTSNDSMACGSSVEEIKLPDDYIAEKRENFNKNCTTPVYFLPRIWKTPDGSMNKTVIIKYLHSVLGYISSTPGISEEKVCQRFSILLPPIQTLELLEFLVKLNCVFRYYTKYIKPKSIFSPRGSVVITKTPELEDKTHYECFADAILKMSYFENQLPDGPSI